MLFVLLYPSSWLICSVCMLTLCVYFALFLFGVVCVCGLRPLRLSVLSRKLSSLCGISKECLWNVTWPAGHSEE